MSTTTRPPDSAEIEAFVGRISTDFATSAATAMIELGDRLGLYRILLNRGPMTEAEVADASGYNPRLVAEWLRSQAANDLMIFEPKTQGYSLTPGASAVLADPDAPTFLAGAVNIITSYYTDLDQVEAAFRGDGGVHWEDHHDCMFSGIEKFFSTAYNNSLTTEWIPALDDVEARLNEGIRVVDVGCGHGIATSLLAYAYPDSQITGVDLHAASIERAKTIAGQRGLDIDYHTGTAAELDGGPYDLICFFDCLHDMGNPDAAIAQARTQLAPGGTVLLVEIHAHDNLAANFADPFSRWWYAASVSICTPTALSQQGEALGNQVGTNEWRRRFLANGFSEFREALRTPFNLVLEARA